MPKFTDEQIKEMATASNYDADVVRAYLSLGITASTEPDEIAEEIQEAYSGQHESDEAFARDMADQLGTVIPDTWPLNCIDWEYAARELMHDYSDQDGHYFRNI